MYSIRPIGMLATILALSVTSGAAAQSLNENLKSMLNRNGSSRAGPAAGGIGNAAGIIQYCIEHNYLGGGASEIKDRLLGRLSGGRAAANDDADYQAGTQGILLGKDGKRSHLDGSRDGLNRLGQNRNMHDVKDKAIRKGCELVLDQSKSLL